MDCRHERQGKYVLNYEFDAWKCCLFKPKQEGYYVVILKCHEAMQCSCSWVDASSVLSLSALYLVLRFIVKSMCCFFYYIWLYHDDKDREMMVQGCIAPTGLLGCFTMAYAKIGWHHVFMV